MKLCESEEDFDRKFYILCME